MRNFATAVCDFTLAAKQLRNSEFLISRLQIFYFSFADTVFGAALALLRMRKRRAGPGRLEEAFVRKGIDYNARNAKNSTASITKDISSSVKSIEWVLQSS